MEQVIMSPSMTAFWTRSGLGFYVAEADATFSLLSRRDDFVAKNTLLWVSKITGERVVG
jgi:hypothetical protein